jgi:hypothetical protein
MSISTYAELKDAVAAYKHRTDLTSQIPDYFIVKAESKLNRRLRLTAQMTTATGSVAATVALPSGFQELISLTVTVGGYTYSLSYKPPGYITGDAGNTAFYSIVGTNIKFERVESGATYLLTYYAKFSALSAGSNWLIENAPDVYLDATMLEAATYVGDADGISTFGAMLESEVASLESADRRANYGTNLRMRAG